MDVTLPVWHSNVHVVKCKTKNSLLYQDEVGKSDREGMERTWAVFNVMAWQTKEMHPEVRHDAIEDQVDHHNFRKNVGLGETLHLCLKIALVEQDAQVKEFQDIDLMLKRDLRAEWKKKVNDWQADHSRPFPYAAQEMSGTTKFPSIEDS